MFIVNVILIVNSSFQTFNLILEMIKITFYFTISVKKKINVQSKINCFVVKLNYYLYLSIYSIYLLSFKFHYTKLFNYFQIIFILHII